MNNNQYPMQYHWNVNPQSVGHTYDPQLAAMENYNHLYAIQKKFLENCKEQTDWNNSQNTILGLEQCPMSHLSPFKFSQHVNINWQHPLIRDLGRTGIWLVDETSLSFDVGYMMVLSCILMATLGKVRSHVKDGWQENAALYILVIAASGSRKSSLYKKVIVPFRGFEKNNENKILPDVQHEFYIELKRLNQQKMRKILKKLSNSKELLLELEKISQEQQHIDSALNPRQLFASIMTPAGFIKALFKNNGNINILDPEPRFLRNLIKEIKILEILLSAYTDEPFKYEHAYATYFFKSLCINICIMCQPDEAQKFLDTKEFVDRGLLARFVPIYSHQTELNRFKDDWSGIAEVYKNKIQALLTYFYSKNQNVIFETSDEARNFLLSSQAFLSFQNTEAFSSFMAKLKGLIVRIATAIHLWNFQGDNDSFEISLTEIQLATDIVNAYIMPSVDFMYGRYNRKVYKMAHKILQRIYDISPAERYKLYNGIAISDLKKMLHAKGTELDIPLELLSSHNFVRILKTHNGADKIIVHPRFYIEFPQLASKFTILD